MTTGSRLITVRKSNRLDVECQAAQNVITDCDEPRDSWGKVKTERDLAVAAIAEPSASKWQVSVVTDNSVLKVD
jgi:hypothetical protein